VRVSSGALAWHMGNSGFKEEREKKKGEREKDREERRRGRERKTRKREGRGGKGREIPIKNSFEIQILKFI
jgi:hypothetical protein